jgi:glycine oxidase
MPDVVIVGAGLVGSAGAYELARRGAAVTLLDFGKAGMQATNAAAGMLAPLSDSEAPDIMVRTGMQALAAYPRVIADLQERCGFELEYRRSGVLRVAFTEDEADTLRRRFAWQRELGLPVEWLDGPLCREVEPRLSPRVVAGVLAQHEATVSNQLLALAFTRAAVACGAVLREGAPLQSTQRTAGRITAVTAGGESHACDTVVVAAGARSGQVGRRLGVALPVTPVRGQMIALGGMAAPVARPVWGPAGYVVPRANGLVFAGATIEHVGFRRRTTRSGVKSLKAAARALVPQLASAKLHFEWAGLRPDTPDHRPIVGPLNGTNVVAATGHYRSGIHLGPLTGAMVAAGIAGGDWSGVPEEFSPARFA